MPLTPADVANVVFSTPPPGQQGYHDDEVDTFLDVVCAELTHLIHHNDNLRSQITHLHHQLATAPADPTDNHPAPPPPAHVVARRPAQHDTVATPQDHPNVLAAKILVRAQQLADQITREATADTEQILTQAHHSCLQLLAQATTEADDVVTQASTRAQTILTTARDQADRLDQQTHDKTAALERQAASQHTEILEPLRQQKAALETKIGHLCAVEHDYCSRMTTYVQSQLRQLNQSNPPPPDPIPQPLDPAPTGPGEASGP